LITKDQKVTLEGNKLVQHNSAKDDFSWVTEKLSFDNTPLNQVIKELSLHFEVEIEYKGKTDLNSCPFTATDLSTATLDQVLAILSTAYDMNVEHLEDGSIKFSRVSCRKK